jgi:predicted P-loop ATPase
MTINYSTLAGWTIFLVPPSTKGGYSDLGHRHTGRKWGASKDPAEIKRMFALHPEANIGIPTGIVNNIFVVDVDTRAGGHRHDGVLPGPVPDTLQAESPSGSMHYYFQYPGFAVKNSASKIAPGVDIRGDGGMVLAPPSVKGSGAYKWRNLGTPIAAAPQWLLDSIGDDEIELKPRTGVPQQPGRALYDFEQCKALYAWCRDYSTKHPGHDDSLDTYAVWVELFAFAAAFEFGDAGRELIEVASYEPAEMTDHKWASCLRAHDNPVKMDSVFKWAKARGWKESVDKPGMFDKAVKELTVPTTDIAKANYLAMLDPHVTEIGRPILERYLDTAGSTAAPAALQIPPEHPLAESLAFAVAGVLAQKRMDGAALDVLAVLSFAHNANFLAIREQLGLNGSRDLSAAVARFEGQHQYARQTAGGWVMGKGNRSAYVDSSSPANVHYLLKVLGCEVRWNQWNELDEIRGWRWHQWTYIDDKVKNLLLTEANKRDFHLGPDFFWQTINAFADDNTTDPALDRLLALENNWDGTKRLDTWVSKTFGVVADEYHRITGRRVIGSMVRRIREPGCKIDEMMLLMGGQGINKGKLAKALCPIEDGFTEAVKLGMEPKELILLLAGKCVAEVSEMEKRNSAGIEAVKAMISATHDHGRTVFARKPTNRPRRNIYIGTTNSTKPLSDPTGNRRFLPIRCGAKVNLDWLEKNIDQLIGEACTLQSGGEKFDVPEEIWATNAEHQEAARLQSDEEVQLRGWLEETEFTKHAYIKPGDLIQLAKWAGWSKNNATRTTIMEQMGFVNCRATIDGIRDRYWLRGNENDPGVVQYAVKLMTDGRPDVIVRSGPRPTAPANDEAPPLPAMPANNNKASGRTGNLFGVRAIKN